VPRNVVPQHLTIQTGRRARSGMTSAASRSMPLATGPR
jgi:hypothetical protein